MRLFGRRKPEPHLETVRASCALYARDHYLAFFHGVDLMPSEQEAMLIRYEDAAFQAFGDKVSIRRDGSCVIVRGKIFEEDFSRAWQMLAEAFNNPN